MEARSSGRLPAASTWAFRFSTLFLAAAGHRGRRTPPNSSSNMSRIHRVQGRAFPLLLTGVGEIVALAALELGVGSRRAEELADSPVAAGAPKPGSSSFELRVGVTKPHPVGVPAGVSVPAHPEALETKAVIEHVPGDHVEHLAVFAEMVGVLEARPQGIPAGKDDHVQTQAVLYPDFSRGSLRHGREGAFWTSGSALPHTSILGPFTNKKRELETKSYGFVSPDSTRPSTPGTGVHRPTDSGSRRARRSGRDHEAIPLAETGSRGPTE